LNVASETQPRKRSVGILIFPEVELLDFAGPHEAFSAAQRADGGLFDVFTVAERAGELRTPSGLRVVPDYTIDDVPHIDILVVPGGMGTRREIDNQRLIGWIEGQARQTEVMTSVCTGSFLLAKAGLLRGKQATTHWGSVERLREMFPDTEVLERVRWVDAGPVISSAGVSAGIDMALHVIERLCGTEAAASSARLMEYDYWKPGDEPGPASAARPT
jgi:transcriptional regulator GlxA family with amidase domain